MLCKNICETSDSKHKGESARQEGQPPDGGFRKEENGNNQI